MCWRRGCAHPCCIGSLPTPEEVSYIPGRWVFLSFSEDVLAAMFSSRSPHLETDCQVMACHTGKTRRWIRQKKPRGKEAKSQGWLMAGLAKPPVSIGSKNTAKYTLSKSFNTIYFMLK